MCKQTTAVVSPACMSSHIPLAPSKKTYQHAEAADGGPAAQEGQGRRRPLQHHTAARLDEHLIGEGVRGGVVVQVGALQVDGRAGVGLVCVVVSRESRNVITSNTHTETTYLDGRQQLLHPSDRARRLPLLLLLLHRRLPPDPAALLGKPRQVLVRFAGAAALNALHRQWRRGLHTATASWPTRQSLDRLLDGAVSG